MPKRISLENGRMIIMPDEISWENTMGRFKMADVCKVKLV